MSQPPDHDPNHADQPPGNPQSQPNPQWYGQQPPQPPQQYGLGGFPAGSQPYPQPGTPQQYPGYGQYPPPPGVDPYSGQPLSDKSKIVAGLLQLLLGTFGAGRFYTGHTGMALGMLFTCGGCGIWALVDGIMLLVNGGTDSEGHVLRNN